MQWRVAALLGFMAKFHTNIYVDDDWITHSQKNEREFGLGADTFVCIDLIGMCLTLLCGSVAHRIVFAQNVINTQAPYY